MTILLPNGLPAAAVLRREGFDVGEASHPDGTRNHTRIGLVNLMPRKEATELAFARLLAQTGHPLELTLILPSTYQPRSTPPEHVDRYYRRWPDVRNEKLDAIIVTGAPVETLPFEQVDYWIELSAILRWARDEVGSGLYICWAAQAALYTFRGLPKSMLPEKAFGVFEQKVIATSPLTRGMGSHFPVPVSRHTEVRRERLDTPGLRVLACSDETGACIVEDRDNRAVCIFDHLEYAEDTLSLEYERDKTRGLPIEPPRNTIHGQSWGAHAALFFRNWVDAVVAQRDHPSAGDLPLTWLFATDREPAHHKPTVIFQSVSRPHLLCEVLNRLASLGISPLSARVLNPGHELTSAVIELYEAASGMMDAIAASLLHLSGSRRVIVRLPSGSGGIFRSRADTCRFAQAA